jgi:Fe-S cluster assembly protein SufD
MDVVEKITVTNKLLKQIESLKFPSWSYGQRKQAFESFKKLGIPNRKSEEYKYCKIDLILKDEFVINSSKNNITIEQLSSALILKEAITIVIVNGHFNENLSTLTNLPKGLIICGLEEAAEKYFTIFENHYSKYADIKTDPFTALNTAISNGGAFIHIDKNSVIKIPIHIVHVSTANENSIVNPRNLIVIEKSAQAKIVESFVTIDSTALTFNNAVTEIFVDENAIVQHYKIQEENDFGNLISTTQVQQEKQNVFTTTTITLNGAFVRNNLNIVLNNQHIESHLNGLYLTNNNQVVDNHTLVDHRMPNCNSNELYKGVVDGNSTATFNGKIFVRKDAQKTNAFQSNKNILLSDDSTVNTKPQLEIYADDVKCSHGTSTGKLDEEKIFYLRARGISEASAKKLLMFAFASEVLNTIEIEPLRDYLENKTMLLFQ